MNRVAIVSAKRTAIGSFGGSLKDVSAVKIGGDLVKQALESVNLDPNLVDEIIFGNVLQTGLGQNVARQNCWLMQVFQKRKAPLLSIKFVDQD